ncbi:Breast cancer type 2 susceptibility protein isoform 2 [Schistosoma japonicum]|uniref:Breast cancer type 2 susceptibility protein isoform 2 n=1 Tax=Schistosoma japonicum TaxID=6182 RepID=A0A4Z2DMA2_SCHJA|nr:Breast cancer type 2 susceptibility protein isoform 2 [Schistosoma japonicum]
MTLEVEREQLRIDQNNLITHSQSITSNQQIFCSSAENTSLNAKLRGLLWNIRSKGNKGTEIVNPIKDQCSLKWHLLLVNSTNHKWPSLSPILQLPKYLKFPNDAHYKWSLQTADKLFWLWDMKYIMDTNSENVLPVSYKFNEFTLIPDKFGCVGKQEIINAFLSCSRIYSNLVPRGWIENHYLQIMWKAGTIALLYNDLCTTLLSDYCTPIHVLNELHYRYDREIEACQRPTLRKVIEQDDTAARRLILCVSRLDISDQCIKKACLTDGWYQISWHPDPMLTTLITSAKIRVGSKLVTAGAELVVTNPSSSSTNSRRKRKCSSGDAQMDQFGHLYGEDGAAIGVALKLHGNSTRPVSCCSRLGFTTKQPSSGAGLYPVPLCTLSSDGGICSSVRVVIQRRYSLQYMETLEVPEQNADVSTHLIRTNSGSDEPSLKSRGNRRRVFRSERAEEAEVRKFEARRREVIDGALDKLVLNDPNKRRIQPTSEQLMAFGNDGEALLHAILNAPDSMEAELNLTQMQRDAIQLYKESVIHDAVAESVPYRQVTPLLRLKVSGIHPRDIASGYGASITLWSPTDEMLSVLKEGVVVEFYRLQVSVIRANDPFAPPQPLPGFVKPIGVNIPSGFALSLSGGRNTRILTLGHISDLKDVVSLENIPRVYHSRVVLNVSEVYHIITQESQFSTNPFNKGNRDVDLRCLIIAIYHSPLPSNLSNKSYSNVDPSDYSRTIDTPFKYPSSDVDCVYATDVNCKSETCLSVIKFRDSLQTLHLMEIVQVGRVLCFTDLQLHHCQMINSVPKLGQPSRAIPFINLHYTSASNVTSEKPAIRRSSRITSASESDPSVISYLQHVVKDFLYSRSGHEIDLQISNSPLNYTKIVTTSSSTPQSIGLGLSSLLRGRVRSNPVHTTAAKTTPKMSISLENPSPILNLTCQSPSRSVLKQNLPLKEQDFTPIKRFAPTIDCRLSTNNTIPKTTVRLLELVFPLLSIFFVIDQLI